MRDIYTNGVEVLCPAVYLSNSAVEAIELVSSELVKSANDAYDAYGDGSGNCSDSASEIINYFLDIDEEDEDE